HLGAGPQVFISHIAERNTYSKTRRKSRRCNASNLFSFRGDNCRARLNLFLPRKQEARQFLRHVSPMLDANNDLLTEVTAFSKTDRVVQICFCNHISLIHVASENSNASLNAQSVQRVVANRLSSSLDD